MWDKAVLAMLAAAADGERDVGDLGILSDNVVVNDDDDESPIWIRQVSAELSAELALWDKAMLAMHAAADGDVVDCERPR